MFLSLLKSQGEGKKRSWWLLLLKRWLQKKPDEAIQSPQPRPV